MSPGPHRKFSWTLTKIGGLILRWGIWGNLTKFVVSAESSKFCTNVYYSQEISVCLLINQLSNTHPQFHRMKISRARNFHTLIPAHAFLEYFGNFGTFCFFCERGGGTTDDGCGIAYALENRFRGWCMWRPRSTRLIHFQHHCFRRRAAPTPSEII